MSALQALILMANEASGRLEAALDRADRHDLPEARGPWEELVSLGSSATAMDELSPDDTPWRLDREEAATRVWQLAQSGRSAPAIAEELGLPLGDVEVLLSLK